MHGYLASRRLALQVVRADYFVPHSLGLGTGMIQEPELEDIEAPIVSVVSDSSLASAEQEA
jgi:hypothetical protein